MNENKITDAFNLMSNSLFNNVIPDASYNEASENYFTNKTADDIELIPEFEDFCNLHNIDVTEWDKLFDDSLSYTSTEFSDSSSIFSLTPSEMTHHECMWSGTCRDSTHKTKKKYKFTHLDELIFNSSDDENDDDLLLSPFREPFSMRPYDRIAKVMGEWDDAFNSYVNDQSNFYLNTVALAAPAPVDNFIQFECPSPPPLPPPSPPSISSIPPPPPPPFQFFAPIQSFFKIKNENPPPLIQFHQQHQHFVYNPLLSPRNQLKQEMQQITVNILNANQTIKTERNQESRIIFKDEQEQNEQPLIQYYPQVTTQQHSSTSPLLFYKNNIFTMDQINNINFVDLPIVNKSVPPVTPPRFFSPLSYNIAKTRKMKRETAKKSRIKKVIQKAKLTKHSRKTPMTTLPFRDMKRTFLNFDGVEPFLKRNMHNCMERQRRIGLKNLFLALKDSIPDLDQHERVPKVAILCRAAEYCHELRAEEKELSLLKNKNNLLLKKLNKLTRTKK